MAEKNNKRLYILLSILGVLFAYLILSRTVFSGEDKENIAEVNTAEVNNIDGVTFAEVEIGSNDIKLASRPKDNRSAVPELQYSGNWTNDPFFYVDENYLGAIRDREMGQYTDLKLSGISLLRDKGYSLINTIITTETDTVMTASILKVGDEFDGYQVLKIAFDHVILRKGNRNIRLELDES